MLFCPACTRVDMHIMGEQAGLVWIVVKLCRNHAALLHLELQTHELTSQSS